VPVDMPVEAPELGEPVPLEDGLFWLRLRLPFALDHVNLLLADDGDGWTLVDTGYGDAPTRAVWEQLLAGPLAGRPVRRVLGTHFHPDHVGQAGWLCAATGAELWISRTEWLTCRALALDDTEGFVVASERNHRRARLDDEVVARQRQRRNPYRKGVAEPPPVFRRVVAGDQVELAGSRWRVLVGEGHAPEQVTLHCAERNLLLAADQILPRISPVIGVWAAEPDADPLGDYLRSLAQYRELPPDCRVFPAHGLPFAGLRERLDQLAAHHEQRLERTLAACAEPATAADVLRALFNRPLDAHQTGFALAETLSHLNRLLRAGRLDRWADADGAWLYRARR
jgi:glyoxylase-like metal-dependent hydrolase (beta-lactamase superfamily II)